MSEGASKASTWSLHDLTRSPQLGTLSHSKGWRLQGCNSFGRCGLDPPEAITAPASFNLSRLRQPVTPAGLESFFFMRHLDLRCQVPLAARTFSGSMAFGPEQETLTRVCAFWKVPRKAAWSRKDLSTFLWGPNPYFEILPQCKGGKQNK